LNKGKTLLISL